MFFVPVSQLSTRDLFYFLENLKIKQDILSWVSRLVRSLDQRALWFPYSRLFFWNSVQESVNSWVFGVFTKSIVVSVLDFFWHISFQKDVFVCWLVEEIITGHFLWSIDSYGFLGCDVHWFMIESPVGRHVLNVFYLKDFVTWQVCEMLSDISLGGVFTLLFATTALVAM